MNLGNLPSSPSAIALRATLVIGVAACGDDAPPADEGGTTEVSTSGGSDADASTSGPAETGDDETGPAPSGPTFAEDVAPILAQHCWSCHVEGGVAPFAFVEYEEAAMLAPAIVPATKSRAMPPWPLDASGECGSFVDERVISDDEIATLEAWLDAGTPAGDLTVAPDPPGEPPGLAEVSATIAIEPYTPQGNPPEQPLDDYRCFVVDPGNATDTVLTEFEVHPGVPEQAHHIVMFALGTDQAAADAVALSGADGRPGYTCFGGANVSSATIVGAWAPGIAVVRYPEGTGAPLPAGRPVVLQMHYNLAAGMAEDTTSVDLRFDSTATPLRSVVLVDTDLAIPPNTPEHTETITTVLDSEDTVLVTAFPHMHQIGERLRVDLQSGACGIDVPRYDFNWQQTYSYVEPLVVPGGTEVTLTCTFDSTGRDHVTTFGEGTNDEMCAVQFFALP